MPTQLQFEMALYDAAEQERQANLSKSIADLVARQPGPLKPSSSSKEGAIRDSDEYAQERSDFSKQWKAVKFSRDEVEALLKEDPGCDRCLRLKIPCTTVKAKLICKECQTVKVVCPRKFNAMVRVLAQKHGETEEEVLSKHSRFMTPSTQKGRGKKGDEEGVKANANAKAKKDEASVNDILKAKEKGKEREKLPTIIIPGNRGSKSDDIEGDNSPKTLVRSPRLSEPRSQHANSRALLDNDEMANEDEQSLKMDVDASGVLKPQSQRSNLEPSHDNNHTAEEDPPTSAMGIDAPQLSKYQPQRSYLGMPPNDDNQTVNEAQNPSQMPVNTPAPSKSEPLRFHSTAPQIPLASKRQAWDYLSRSSLYELLEGLEAELNSTREELEEVNCTKDALDAHLLSITEGLEDCRKRVKDLENSGVLTMMAASLENSRDMLVKAKSDLRQVETQRLEGELELFELRRKVEALEKDQALNKAQQLTDEPRGPKQFGWVPPSDGWTAQEKRRNAEIFDKQRYPPLGAQPNPQIGNHDTVATLGGLLARRAQMFEEEKDRQELETEAARLRSELGKAHLFSHLLSEFSRFVREVQTSIYALDTIEDSVNRETDFNTATFHSMLFNLSEACTSAKERIDILDQGRYKLVGFVEKEGLKYTQWYFPSPSQETRGQKRKQRDDDNGSRDGSMC